MNNVVQELEQALKRRPMPQRAVHVSAQRIIAASTKRNRLWRPLWWGAAIAVLSTAAVLYAGSMMIDGPVVYREPSLSAAGTTDRPTAQPNYSPVMSKAEIDELAASYLLRVLDDEQWLDVYNGQPPHANIEVLYRTTVEDHPYLFVVQGSTIALAYFAQDNHDGGKLAKRGSITMTPDEASEGLLTAGSFMMNAESPYGLHGAFGLLMDSQVAEIRITGADGEAHPAQIFTAQSGRKYWLAILPRETYDRNSLYGLEALDAKGNKLVQTKFI